MLQRKIRAFRNPSQLSSLPHVVCLVPGTGACLSARGSSWHAPNHSSVSRLPAPSKLHSPHIPAAWDTPSCLFPHGAQPAAMLWGKPHTHCWVLCSFPGERVLVVEDKFYHSTKCTRCHAPIICKCIYSVWSQPQERCHITYLLPFSVLPCILHAQNYGYTASFLLAARLGCVSCSSLKLQKLIASSLSCYFCALPWHSVKKVSCPGEIGFIISVFSSLPCLGILPPGS